MTQEERHLAPVWTLSTTDLVTVPDVVGDVMTPDRLTELRSALASFADSPIVTLEAHPLPTTIDRSRGILLDAVSPLARELAKLVSQTSKASPAMTNVAGSGEVLYRMVVPAKVAAQVGAGLMKPMKSSAVAGGIHSALTNSRGIAAQASFVPVQAATAGAATGAAGTAAAGATGAAALTIAAPLVLMAVAVGVSAYADQQRQKAIENITEMLERLHDDNIDRERSELDGCRDAIDKATALLLDQGKVGASLGLDSAVHAIGKATEQANRRLRKWQTGLDALPVGPVELGTLLNTFRGIDQPGGGEFRAHLELADLAIALKRRVIVLQAVEAAQSDPDNLFGHFVRSLRADQQRVDELEAGIAAVLSRLSTVELRPSSRLKDRLMTRGEVDAILKAAYSLREFNARALTNSPAADVAIEIAQHKDGTVLVLPASAA